MSSIVIDLQDEILSSNCDIVQILRRAHVIAVKLGLKEFDQWISYELNGYSDQNACPDYCKVRGTLFQGLVLGTYCAATRFNQDRRHNTIREICFGQYKIFPGAELRETVIGKTPVH